ncbi:MAG: hypothetical protein C0462_12210 [Alcanivorax sp.]|nr:hypothetical protein [Alcanivorax sp.]
MIDHARCSDIKRHWKYSTKWQHQKALRFVIESGHGDTQRGIMLFDESSTEQRIQTLAREFKYSGHTWGKTNNFAEVPVFLDSRASRLIQLADLVAYSLFRFHEYGDSSFYDVIQGCFDSEGGVVHGLYVRS